MESTLFPSIEDLNVQSQQNFPASIFPLSTFPPRLQSQENFSVEVSN